jgi:hypothetical protein
VHWEKKQDDTENVYNISQYSKQALLWASAVNDQKKPKCRCKFCCRLMKESLGGSIQSLFTLLIHHGCEGNFNPSHLDYLMENGPIYYNNKPQGLMLFGIAPESDLPHSWFANIKTTSNKMDYNASDFTSTC